MSIALSWQDLITREEIIHRLREIARVPGMSHEKMAKAIGYGLTRHAVAGLCRRAKPPIVTKRAEEMPAAVPAVIGTKLRFVIVDEIIPGSLHLMDLRRAVTQCRAPLWPHRLHTRIKVKTHETHFCGKPTIAGSPYCEEHRQMFLTKDAPKPNQKNSDRAKAGSKMRRLQRELAGE